MMALIPVNCWNSISMTPISRGLYTPGSFRSESWNLEPWEKAERPPSSRHTGGQHRGRCPGDLSSPVRHRRPRCARTPIPRVRPALAGSVAPPRPPAFCPVTAGSRASLAWSTCTPSAASVGWSSRSPASANPGRDLQEALTQIRSTAAGFFISRFILDGISRLMVGKLFHHWLLLNLARASENKARP